MRILFSLLLCLVFALDWSTTAQTQVAPALWQVDSFDLAVNVQQAERQLGVVATLKATNVGGSPGRTFTIKLHSKAKISSVTVNGAPSTFRAGSDPRGDLMRAEVSLTSAASPNTTATLVVNYTLPIESNSGNAAISPVGTQFLPLSIWYPTPNTQYTLRGADTAPFRVSVNLPNVVSSGIDKSSGGTSVFEQPLSGQPFFVQGNWDKIDGAGEGKGISVLIPKGSNADERKQAEVLVAFTSAARAFFAGAFGEAPDVPIRLVSVRRGTESDSGTVLFDANTLRLPRIDAATALSIAEAISRLWFGGQVPIRGEGSGAIKEGLARFLATQFLEKQFGHDAVQSELLRERIAYAAVAQRDAPLARASQLDSTYWGSVPNRGAMFWRLVDRRLGHDAFLAVLKSALQSGKTDNNGVTLSGLRAAIVQRGGDALKLLLDQQLDQVIDTDLLVGLPQSRGNESVSALRNLGSIDVTVNVVATTEQGQTVQTETTIPAKNFAEAVFKTPARIVRVEVDPEKLYPQTDYGNDTVPRVTDLPDALNQGASQLGGQDYAKAEATARQMLVTAPRLQEARVLLGRALVGENKLDEAEKVFRASLDEPLPFTATLAWANIGLGEISMKRNQPAEAAKRFNDAVFASRDYPSSLAARSARIRAEQAANTLPPVDESVRAFVTQFSQAVVSGKKAELESRVVPGELAGFIKGSIGTEVWNTTVVRTEQLNADLIAADVNINVKQLAKEGTLSAVFMLARTPTGLKLFSIELIQELHQ
jgi:tetratricopeptide (TPR) repeat protein